MNTRYFCTNKNRLTVLKDDGTLNGIDYLEVLDSDAPAGSPRQRTLLVYCVLPVAGLSADNIRITGGVRMISISADWAYPASSIPASLLTTDEQTFFSALTAGDQILVVRTDSSGDYSTYKLTLVSSPTDESAPAGFDPQVSAIGFSFKVECPSEFDCEAVRICPPEIRQEPDLNYLAKDYSSFRRLIYDRMSVLMPSWKERNPADIAVALVEVLAYAGDRLSYFQDAVATEAYLGTARKRVSVRRHARLLDYRMHDGCNARTWIHFEVESSSAADGYLLPAGTTVLSKGNDSSVLVAVDDIGTALRDAPVVFQTMHDLPLHSSHNTISFYTWDDAECCLSTGATKATLANDPPLFLTPGDVLVFEEVRSPTTGKEQDADQDYRCAVRLTRADYGTDPLHGTSVLEIEWDQEDALPFPLCIKKTVTGGDGVPQELEIGVARANVALADHGRTVEETLPSVPADSEFSPQLQSARLSSSTEYDDTDARGEPASSVLRQDPRAALPAIRLLGDDETWTPKHDLLASDRFAADFVVEVERDESACLRFGSGEDGYGKRPPAGTMFSASYRVGNGTEGNVGSDSLARVVTDISGISGVRNPLAALGGIDPESIEQVKLYAPQAFRTPERAVTEADYAEVAERHREVQKAVAVFRWTGSWTTVFVTIDRIGGLDVDTEFESEIRSHLEQYRLAGYDLEITGPVFVSLDVAMKVCVKTAYLRSNVKEELFKAFSTTDSFGGMRGFFHPDNFTFGQAVYLSQLYKTALSVAGVSSVEVTRFQRWGREPNTELENGALTPSSFEIIRLDNDPNFPENGKIDFDMAGGI